MKPTAQIRDWMDCGIYLIGKIEGHPNQGWFLGGLQKTSQIVRRPEVLKEGNSVETENTVYILGKPFAIANEEMV